MIETFIIIIKIIKSNLTILSNKTKNSNKKIEKNNLEMF